MYRNDRTERARLHQLWIEEQDQPCIKCGSREQREIAHIVPYHLGGETTEDNCRVLCRKCNHAEHQSSKFLVGDRVSLNGRTPAFVDIERHRPRTIIRIEYNPQHKCNYYTLGSNGRGIFQGNGNPQEGTEYKFRSYMLVVYAPRQYHFHRPYTRKANFKKEATKKLNAINTLTPAASGHLALIAREYS